MAEICFYGSKISSIKNPWLFQTSVSMRGKFFHRKYTVCGRNLFIFEENSFIKNMLAVANICFYGRKIPTQKICCLWQKSVSMGGKFLHRKYAGCGRHLFLWEENSPIKNMLAVAEICFYGGRIPP